MKRLREEEEEERGEEREGSGEGKEAKKVKRENIGLTAVRRRKTWPLSFMGRNNECDLPGPSNINLMDKTSGSCDKEKYREAKGAGEEGAKRKRIIEENSPSRKKVKTSAAETSASETSGQDVTFTYDNDKPGAPQEEARTATIPLGLDCFTFHHKLGEGAFGQVILAKDIIRQEHVAIKKGEKQYFVKWKEDFIERDILRMTHECRFLIHGLAAFHSLNHVYYVMELAGGGDLTAFINKQFPLESDTVRFIAAELVCGIQFLHGKNIIHRDLKPDNILITSDGHVKISDFGLSIIAPSGRARGVCGTPAYSAPEVTRSKSYGPGVDWFSFGVILYKMVTKRLPSLRNTKLISYPKSPGPETADVIKRLLCINPSERLGVTGRIQEHPFFSNINWRDIEAGQVTPPKVMGTISKNTKIRNTIPAPCSYFRIFNIKADDQSLFTDFSFVSPKWSENYHVNPNAPMYPDTWLKRVFPSMCTVS
ncbi:protein kinase C delta type-like [Hyla sarda]|uniref:protein kinase C delta type-like n=1 Tax=Hyla sarda TaxID=327740 RepID=UPI0024C4338A|nr:protein kinase C delta type-like [Hyla sarda]